MKLDPFIKTPSIYLQGVINDSKFDKKLILGKKQFQNMCIVPESHAFKMSLSKHEVKKLVATKTHVAILTGRSISY